MTEFTDTYLSVRPGERKAGDVDPSLDATLVSATIVRFPLHLRFPAALERQFEKDTGATRCRELIWRGIVALVLMDLFLFVDFFTVPDVFDLSVQLRLGVVTFLAFALIILLRTNPHPILREGLEAGMGALSAGVLLLLAMQTQSHVKADYSYGLVLVIMFLTVVQVIRFWFALAACVVITAMTFLYIFSLDAALRDHLQLLPGIVVGCVVLCLTSSYSIERDSRMAYLNNLLQRLYAGQLADMSARDPLTGLGNRRSLDRHFDLLRAGDAERRSVAIIMVDIDFFKSYNDAYGHLEGDNCLKTVASIIAAQARDNLDCVYRFGGEEFVVLMPDTTATAAAATAERMRLALVAARIPHRHPHPHSIVTASFGVGWLPVEATSTLSQVLRDADAALYHAKRSGRNRVATFAEIPADPLRNTA